MKKFFRLVSTLAVAGLAFAYTGCTDYSEDVNRLDERIDGHIATTEEQYKKLEEADGKLQTAIDEANKSIDALETHTASLQSELTALKEKHETDIEAVKSAHAADKATLETALGKKADQTALDNLDTKYANEISRLEEAYKQADDAIKELIAANGSKINTLTDKVANIENVVIPAVKKQIEDLEKKADDRYATKVALTDSTAAVTARVNKAVGALTTTLEGIEKRLSEVETAHKALKEDFDNTKADHESRIKNLETTLATLKSDHATDVANLEKLIAAAKTAADNAADAAAAAQTAADNAQTTADKAVSAAAAAQTAAAAAQTTANEALGKVDALIEALGVYDKEGKVLATIQELLDADASLAARLLVCEKNDVDLSAAIKHKVDSLAGVISGQLSEINEDLGKKFDADKFGSEFNKEFEKYIADGKFDTAFGTAFSKVLNDAFGQETLEGALDKYLETAFDGKNYSQAISDGIKAALEADKEGNPVGAIAKAIQTAVSDLKTTLEDKITTVQNDLNTRINNLADDIILVVGDLANRIQSVTFVPEYDDMCASLYYYYISRYEGYKQTFVSLSDKTVKAKFEVYPRKQAKEVAAWLVENSRKASIVAVPLKSWSSRAAAAVVYGNVKSAVETAPESGVIDVEVVFNDEDVNYAWASEKEGEATCFAIALRVEAPAEDEIETGKKDEEDKDITETVDAGKYIESAYVPVRLAEGCNLNDKFDIWYFEKDEKGEDVAVKPFDETVERNVAWSADRDTTKWNYFNGAQYAIQIAAKGEPYDEKTTTYKTLAEAAKIMNLDDVTKITPVLTVNETVFKGGKDVTKTHKKFFTTQTPGTLAGSQIDLSEEAAKDPENSVNSSMYHAANFSLKVGETTLANVINPRGAFYNIVRREIKFEILPYESNKIDWTYSRALALTSGRSPIVRAYDKPLVFNKENEVVRKDSEKDVEIKLGELLKTPVSYYIVNGEKKDKGFKPIDISMVAEDVDDIAKVKIPAGKYKFLQGKENKYDITVVYAVDGKFQTDYKVDFSYVLGAMPNDVTVTLDEFKFDYVVKGDAVKSFTKNEVVAMTKKQMTPDEVKMFLDGEKDLLWESINQKNFAVKDKQEATRISGKVESKSLNYRTVLSVLDGGITLKAANEDILTFGDQFTYKTVRQTWYGVKYTYQTAGNVEIIKPDFSLTNSVRSETVSGENEPKVFHADISNQDITKRTDRYQLNKTINLSEYFDVTKKGVDYNNLVVVYETLTKENKEGGIINVPKIETKEVNVNPSVSVYTYKIDPSYISWLNATSYENSVATWFTGLNYNVGLTLKYDGKILDTAELQLVTPDPIVDFGFDENVISVSTGNKTAYLWNKMNVFGRVDKDAQLIWHDAGSLPFSIDGWHSAPEQIINAKTYGCKVTFAPREEVRVYVGGVATSINDTKFVYLPDKGTITFTGDLAELKKDVTFEIDAVLNHFLDKAGKEPKTATAVVTFKK